MKRILLSILLVCFALTAAAKGKQFILCIDPGHGGHDAGAVGLRAKEKNINLEVALAFGKLVEQHCKDVKVIYTRKTDVFVTLQGRADIANQAGADLFVSVHTNSVPDGHWAYGSETYALGKESLGSNYSVVLNQGRISSVNGGRSKLEGYDAGRAESVIGFDVLHMSGMEQGALMAQYIQRWYTKAGRVDKGVKPGVWLVLRRTVMPAVLTELGFISTPDEEDYLTSTGGVNTLARCLFNAFIDYRNALDHQKRKTIALNAAPSPRPRPNPQTDVPASQTQQTPAQTQNNRQQPTQQTQPQQQNSRQQGQNNRQQPVQQAQPQQQNSRQQGQNNRQQQTNRQQPQQQAPRTNRPAAAPKVCFKVQLLSSAKQLSNNDPQLKGLKDIDFYKEGNLYKYTTGSYDNVAAARKLKAELADKFPGAFVIAFIDGKRVSVQEAIDQLKKK